MRLLRLPLKRDPRNDTENNLKAFRYRKMSIRIRIRLLTI